MKEFTFGVGLNADNEVTVALGEKMDYFVLNYDEAYEFARLIMDYADRMKAKALPH